MKERKQLFSVLLDKEDTAHLAAIAAAHKKSKSEWMREHIRKEAKKVAR